MGWLDRVNFRKSPNDDIVVIHAPTNFFGDLYHVLLQAPWWAVIAGIAVVFLGTNVAFAVGYLLSGGIANARPGSFEDAFFFSVQTLGTIGYGTMFPATRAANLLVTAEAVASLAVSALATGIVFAKFSMPTARLAFSRDAVVYKMDGQPTLALRIGNTRGNFVVEAQVRVVLVRQDPTKEGVAMYRMVDLPLVRDRSPALGRSWIVLHRIDAQSPLFGQDNDTLASRDSELIVSVIGIDGTSAQTIHGRHVYDAKQVRFSARHADMMTPLKDGKLLLDYSKFHDVIVAEL